MSTSSILDVPPSKTTETPQIDRDSFEITKLSISWRETEDPLPPKEEESLLDQELLEHWIEMELIKAGPFGVNQWPD